MKNFGQNFSTFLEVLIGIMIFGQILMKVFNILV